MACAGRLTVRWNAVSSVAQKRNRLPAVFRRFRSLLECFSLGFRRSGDKAGSYGSTDFRGAMFHQYFAATLRFWLCLRATGYLTTFEDTWLIFPNLNLATLEVGNDRSRFCLLPQHATFNELFHLLGLVPAFGQHLLIVLTGNWWTVETRDIPIKLNQRTVPFIGP